MFTLMKLERKPPEPCQGQGWRYCSGVCRRGMMEEPLDLDLDCFLKELRAVLCGWAAGADIRCHTCTQCGSQS